MGTLDFSEFDPEDRGGGMPLPGKAHFLVADVKDEDDQYIVTAKIVAHESPSEVGKTSKVYLSLSGKAAKRTLIYALATKLITEDDIARAKDQGSEMDMDIEKTHGRAFFGTLVESEYRGKQRCSLEWDFRADDEIDDTYPVCKDYSSQVTKQKPKDEEDDSDSDGSMPF